MSTPDTDNSTIPGYLVELFFEEVVPGVSQREIARRLGVQPNQVSIWKKTGLKRHHALALVASESLRLARQQTELVKIAEQYKLETVG